MKNRGQTTVLFSCMISVLLIFTLSALEVGRIYCGKTKIKAVIHSTQSGIMADYNRELFERYHLLFMDPTYGTGSDAIVEEKFRDYMDTSLNGRDSSEKLYSFSVEEIALVSKKTITDDHMAQLKKQITEYEKGAGAVRKVTELGKEFVDSSMDIKNAGEKTERNATVIAENTEENSEEETGEDEVEDPREVLKKSLELGVLALVLPEGDEISKEKQDFSDAVSKEYKDHAAKEKDAEFTDITKLVGLLGESAKENDKASLNVASKIVFSAYVLDHFSYYGSPKDTVMGCEAEYILKGKDNDYDNLKDVVSDIIWMRMPINYIYILQDAEKQTETLTLATAICTATGTMPMVEIVNYLLLGCWSYGESIYEVRQLMHGEKIPYVKTALTWNTDLKTLAKTGQTEKVTVGMDYEDYLHLMLAKKESRDITYARVLDLIEKNLQRKDENLTVINLCGAMTIQGKVKIDKLLVDKGDSSAYEYYFEEEFEY